MGRASRQPSTTAVAELGARQQQRLTTRNKITSAVNQLVVERGATGTTFAAVAERAGVSEATVYLHYANKDELLAGALAASETLDALAAATSARPGDEHPVASMMFAYDQLIAQLPDDERNRRIAIAQASEVDTVLTGLVQRGREILARRLAEALQRRPGTPIDWETAVAWATFFATLDVAGAMISRPGWTFDDAHAAIQRLAKIVVPQALPNPNHSK